MPLRPRRRCPICRATTTQDHYPFCSKRCADIDLGRWLSGRYRIAGAVEDDDRPDADDPSQAAASTGSESQQD